jgi:hypothetical protein
MSGARQNRIRAVMATVTSVSARPTSTDPFLPPNCPVQTLGKCGSTFYYIDSQGQLAALPGREHSRLGILTLFDEHKQFLYDTWPRKDKDGNTTGWRPERGAEDLMGSCGWKGVWDPTDRVRGRGAWCGERGELVLHTGQHVTTFAPNPNVWADRIIKKPGLIGRYVYPAGEEVGAPAETVQALGCMGPGHELLALLRTWKWRRMDLDPILLLGWIGAAMIGGALDWRAIIWVTGGKGTGKSTLLQLLESVLDYTLVKLSDASEAHVRQTLKHQTLPVMLDEAESEEDNRKLQAIVKLARIAASGGKIGRGGSDHTAVEFTMRSAFLFGSILIPPLLGQDRSRIGILELGELSDDATRIDVSHDHWAPFGAQLRRRMVEGWGRWEATLDWFRVALGRAGHSRRGQDQFGTLLAAADMLLHDGEVHLATAGEWVTALKASDLAELDDDARDEDRCILKLMTTSVDPFRNGGRKTLGQWTRIAAGWDSGDAVQAGQVLQSYGLRVRADQLLIANYHTELATLFADSHWAGRAGSQGVWVQAVRRLVGATNAGAVYFGGPTSRATAVPLASILQRHDPDASNASKLV